MDTLLVKKLVSFICWTYVKDFDLGWFLFITPRLKKKTWFDLPRSLKNIKIL